MRNITFIFSFLLITLSYSTSFGQIRPPGDPSYEPPANIDTIIDHLAAREAMSLPKPDCPKLVSGKDIVYITVNKKGVVISAKGGHNGSNITDAKTIECDEAAAKKSKFNDTEWGPEEQVGTIVYNHKIVPPAPKKVTPKPKPKKK